MLNEGIEMTINIEHRAELVDLIYKKIHNNVADIKLQWMYPKGTNTKHFFVDNLLPMEMCQEIYNSFPKDANGFLKLKSFREKKKTSVDLENYDPILAHITYAFHDEKIVNLISEIIGFTQIEPDPFLYAGGLSMMFKGDYLNPHLDNSHDSSRNKYRRLNLLYYVSPNWNLENGGNFELWDDRRLNVKIVPSKTNRLIVMETNKKTWHSVNKVLVDEPRCCVSNYYFSQLSPDDHEYFHVTSFTGRPNEKIKRIFSLADNKIRNFISEKFKISRGKKRDRL